MSFRFLDSGSSDVSFIQFLTNKEETSSAAKPRNAGIVKLWFGAREGLGNK